MEYEIVFYFEQILDEVGLFQLWVYGSRWPCEMGVWDHWPVSLGFSWVFFLLPISAAAAFTLHNSPIQGQDSLGKLYMKV